MKHIGNRFKGICSSRLGQFITALDIVFLVLFFTAAYVVAIQSIRFALFGLPIHIFDISSISLLCLLALIVRYCCGFYPCPFTRSRIDLISSALNVDRVVKLMLAAFVVYNLVFMSVITLWAKLPTTDLVIFHEGIIGLSHGGGFYNSIQHIQMLGLEHYANSAHPIVNGFVFHQNFILYLFVPLYVLLSHPLMLQVAPVFFVTICAWLVFRASFHELQDRWEALGCTCVFLAVPAVLQMTTGFLPDCFSILFLTLFFYFVLKEKEWAAIAALVFFSLIRENYCIITIGLGLYFLLYRKKKQFGLIIIGLGLVHLVLGMWLLPPLFSHGEQIDTVKTLHLFSKFGKSLPQIALNMIGRPHQTIWMLIRPDSLVYYALLLAPFIRLTYRRPLLLVIVPFLCINTLSGATWAVKSHLHHSWPLIPIIFFTWLEALKSYRHGRVRLIKITVAACLVTTLLSGYGHSMSSLRLFSRDRNTGRLTITEMLEQGAKVRHMLSRIESKAAVAVDVRGYAEFLFCMNRDRVPTIYTRDIETAEYLIRSEMITNGENSKHVRISKGFSDASDRLDRRYFNDNRDLLWEEMAGYTSDDGQRRSLWKRRPPVAHK